jgi:hypothetical protein
MKRRASSRPAGPRCISCGCTEAQACLVMHWGELQGCSWILLDNKRKEGLCSACATPAQLAYRMLTLAQGFTVESLSACIGRSRPVVRRALRQLEKRGLAKNNRQLGIWQSVRAT